MPHPHPNAPTIPATRVVGTIGKTAPTTARTLDAAYTYGTNKYGRFVQHYNGDDHAADAQLLPMKTIYTTLHVLWQTLTPEQRQSWQNRARVNHTTPIAAFLSVNSRRMMHGLPAIATPA